MRHQTSSRLVVPRYSGPSNNLYVILMATSWGITNYVGVGDIDIVLLLKPKSGMCPRLYCTSDHAVLDFSCFSL